MVRLFYLAFFQRYFKILKSRNIEVVTKFNYFENFVDDIKIEPNLLKLTDDELSSMFSENDEKLFNRKKLAKHLTEIAFARKKFKYLLFCLLDLYVYLMLHGF